MAVKATVSLCAAGEKVLRSPFSGFATFNWPQNKLLGVRRVREVNFNFPGFSYC